MVLRARITPGLSGGREPAAVSPLRVRNNNGRASRHVTSRHLTSRQVTPQPNIFTWSTSFAVTLPKPNQTNLNQTEPNRTGQNRTDQRFFNFRLSPGLLPSPPFPCCCARFSPGGHPRREHPVRRGRSFHLRDRRGRAVRRAGRSGKALLLFKIGRIVCSECRVQDAYDCCATYVCI